MVHVVRLVYFRPQYNLTDETSTVFKLERCLDQSCIETDNNAILDISPDSIEDPFIWLQARAVTKERYVHIRDCSYGFETFKTTNTNTTIPTQYSYFAHEGCIYPNGGIAPLFQR